MCLCSGKCQKRKGFSATTLAAWWGVTNPHVHGSFHFDVQTVEQTTTIKMGVKQRRIRTELRRTGNFIDQSHGRDGRGNDQGIERDLQCLANTLNSGENFEMNDSFNLTFVHVCAGPRGTSILEKVKPGYRHPAIFKKMRRSVALIKNKDELCCARALVMAKAIVKNHPQTQNFQTPIGSQSTLRTLPLQQIKEICRIAVFKRLSTDHCGCRSWSCPQQPHTRERGVHN